MERLKYYSFSELIVIVAYKVAYKIRLAVSEVWQYYFPVRWSRIVTNKIIEGKKFEEFYKHCGREKDAIISEADKVLCGEVEIFGSTFHFDPLHDWLNDPVSGKPWDDRAFFVKATTKQKGLADVKYVLEINKFNHLVRVALAYYHTHDERYTQYIKDAIIGWRAMVTPYRSVVNRIIMDKGFRIINLIQIILLCHEDLRFRDETLPLINGIIKDEVEAIMSFHTAKWFKTGNGLNHVTGEMVGVMIGQWWLEYCRIQKYTSAYGTEMKYLLEVLDRTIAPSGAYLEQSDNYARVVAEFLVAFKMFCNSIAPVGFPIQHYESGNYTERLLYYLNAIAYKGQLPNIGDNDDARILVAFREKEDSVNYVLNFLDSNFSCERDFSDGSSMLYRSLDEKEVYVFMRAGRHSYVREGAGSHAHNDLLSVIIGFSGKMLFVDKGCRFYNVGEDIRSEDRKYSSHNTSSLDNLEINRMIPGGYYLDYPKSEILCNEYKDRNCHLAGTLEYCGIRQTRHVKYDGSYILVEDTINSPVDHIYEGRIHYLLHKDFSAIADEENNVIILNYNGEKIANISIKGAGNVVISKESYSPSFARNVDSVSICGKYKVQGALHITTEIFIC